MTSFLSTTLEYEDSVEFVLGCTFSDKIFGIYLTDSPRPSSSSTGYAHTLTSPLTDTSVQFRGLRSQTKKQPVWWRNNLSLVARMDTRHRETGRGVLPLAGSGTGPDPWIRARGLPVGAQVRQWPGGIRNASLESSRAIADRKGWCQE